MRRHWVVAHRKGKMPFTFQQPGSALLLGAIGSAAAGADGGIAMFAFASAGGVKAFFAIPEVAALLAAKKPLHLVVGLDAITNAEALLSISDIRKKYGAHVTAEAFFHEHPASTFHPKFAQFRVGADLRLITGSGNLTARGLGLVSAAVSPPGNWEAFSTQTIRGAAARSVADSVVAWLAAQRASLMLRPLTDEKVKARAMANGLVRYSSKATGSAQAKPPVAVPASIPLAASTAEAAGASVVDTGDSIYDAQDILVRELPRNRPGQADIGKNALSEFFGYAGKAIDVLLQHVTLDNVLGGTESIRLFVNDSQNYRLELHAMKGVKYAVARDDSRMILVATKLDGRSFRYTVVPTDSPAHEALIALLGTIAHGRRFMREKRVTPDALMAGWTSVPSNLVPKLSESPPV